MMSPSIRFTGKMLLCTSLAIFVLQLAAGLFPGTASSGKMRSGCADTHSSLVMQQQADMEMNEYATLKTLCSDIPSIFLRLEITETSGPVEASAQLKGFERFAAQQCMLSAVREGKMKNISITNNMGRAGPAPGLF